MKIPIGPQYSSIQCPGMQANPNVGVEIPIGPTERVLYYERDLPSCAGPLKDARCMKNPASTPNPTPTKKTHAHITAMSTTTKKVTANRPGN